MNNICIITSALGSSIGAVSLIDRFEQTKVSIQTVRDKIPNCIIILSDISVISVDNYKLEISKLVDIFLDFKDNSKIFELSLLGLKSHGELLLFRETIEYIELNINLTNINRIFKLSGRHNISEEFLYSNYDIHTNNKYVFKTAVNSWISPDLKLYETRLWSMHSSNIDNYCLNFKNIFNSCDGTFDIEHAYYKFLPKSKVVEFNNIWVEGIVAADAHYQKD